MKTIITLAVSLTLIACGSQFPRQSGYRGGDNSQNAHPGTGSCQVTNLTGAELQKGYDSFDINKLEVLNADKKSRSLCEFMKDNKLDVAIFQFSGVLCSSCQEESIWFEKELGTAGLKNVGHVVVLTDFLSDYPESSFEKFMEMFAPKGLRAHDPEIELWKHFSKNPAEPVRPTVIAVNRNGVGKLINTDGADVSPIMDAVKSLAVSSGDQEEEEEEEEGGDDNGLPALQLTDAQNFSFKNSAGQDKKLSDVFKSEYMIVDMSQYFCTYCKQLADEHQNDSEFHAQMNGKKCRFTILIPNADRSSWYNRYGSGSFINGISNSVQSQQSIAQAYNVGLSSIPMVFMFDRKGKVVGREVGGLPAEVNSLCKE